MAYTINLIQRVSDGAILGSCGCAFSEISTQADYGRSLFITGDPDGIPDIYGGFSPGEYRIMTFMTYGEEGSRQPTYNGSPFANIAQGANTNNANMIFVGDNRFQIVSNNGIWNSFVSEYYNNGTPPTYMAFTQQQLDDNNIGGVVAIEDIRNYPATLAGLFVIEIYELDYNGGFIYGWMDLYQSMNVAFFFSPR